MKKQHAYLLSEMRALQKQHEEYDARIRTTEAIAEAAEAAATQIRDLEQQLVAIETKDGNKVFEKWASDEITRLGMFAVANESLGQRQIEVDAKVSHISENLDRLLRGHVDLEGVLRRLDFLENDRREDAKRIQKLEREVNCLRSRRESYASCSRASGTGLGSREETREELTPPQKPSAEMSVVPIESDNEEALLPRVTLYEEMQVPQSPEVQEM